MFKRVKNQKGFTLIELVAVIAILGVLALLIVPRVGNYTAQAKVSKAKGDITILKNAIERYNAEHTTALSGTLSTNQNNLTTQISGFGPYIDKLPLDSVTGGSTIANIMLYNTDSLTTTSTIPVNVP